MTPAKTEPAIIIHVNKQREGYIFDLRRASRVGWKQIIPAVTVFQPFLLV
ncbi:MAG: hypothetical protein R3E79_28735 [Caldilineaceae bacterium]